jgi:hypothetical protein
MEVVIDAEIVRNAETRRAYPTYGGGDGMNALK